MEDVFPLSIEGLWELLHAHLDEVRLPEIHPRVLWGRLVREEGTVEYLGLTFPREKVVERAYRIGGRSLTTTWDYRIEPPDRYAYDVTFPMARPSVSTTAIPRPPEAPSSRRRRKSP